MIALPEPPHLEPPTERVRISYLTGEQADAARTGADTDWLAAASRDFAAYAAARREVRERWGVPSTILWWVSGEHYLGTLVLRHRLTHELAELGGHIGYHVVLPWRRQGHATRMLGAGLREAAAIGLDRVLVTCDAANEASRKVILANGGESAGGIGREDRFWIRTPQPS